MLRDHALERVDVVAGRRRDRHDVERPARAPTPRSAARARAWATRSILLSATIDRVRARGVAERDRVGLGQSLGRAGRGDRSRRPASARRRRRRPRRSRRRACSGAAGRGRPARPGVSTYAICAPGPRREVDRVDADDPIARGLRLGRHRDQPAPEQTVQQRRLADIGQADDRAEAGSDIVHRAAM